MRKLYNSLTGILLMLALTACNGYSTEYTATRLAVKMAATAVVEDQSPATPLPAPTLVEKVITPLPVEATQTAVPSETATLTPLPATATPAASHTPDAAHPFEIVELQHGSGNLPDLLKAEAQAALALGHKPFIEGTATWCANCAELNASLTDPRMIDAFSGTHIIRVDVDEWKTELAAAGFKVQGIPAFYEIDADGRPTGRSIDGGAWAENIPVNMAPPLKAFFQGN
jgi:hypothetical protein